MKTIWLGLVTCIVLYFLGSFKTNNYANNFLGDGFSRKVYVDFDEAAFKKAFVKTLDSLSLKFDNPSVLKKYYEENGYTPTLIKKFYSDYTLDSLNSYLHSSNVHGFNPEIFSSRELDLTLEKLRGNNFKNEYGRYLLLSKLEILSASAYSRYAKFLKFGLVNPRAIFSRYYIEVKKPDSIFTKRLLNSVNLLDTLKALQPQSNRYKSLQQEFLQSTDDSLRKILLVNMERLRWVLPTMGSRYVQVNIPDFRLIYFNDGDTLTQMKVCVGGKRDLDYDEKLKIYAKTRDILDKPRNRETPILVSNINYVFANPVWSVPESIAQTEIYPNARRNSRYLKKHNIIVYLKDKNIEVNPYDISWRDYDQDNLPFQFVQQPGDGNSLGRLKFSFPNKSSVYLHDTNFKKGFKYKNRAISHGCVRVEKPLKLAEVLFADVHKYDQLRMEVGLMPIDTMRIPAFKKRIAGRNAIDVKLETVAFKPKKPVPLLITYYTAWTENNKIEYRPDVYGMDEKLWLAMEKFR